MNKNLNDKCNLALGWVLEDSQFPALAFALLITKTTKTKVEQMGCKQQ